MLYESEPIQHRHAFRLWNKTEIGSSNNDQRGRIFNNKGLVMEKIWLYSEISDFKTWEDYSRGFIN